MIRILRLRNSIRSKNTNKTVFVSIFVLHFLYLSQQITGSRKLLVYAGIATKDTSNGGRQIQPITKAELLNWVQHSNSQSPPISQHRLLWESESTDQQFLNLIWCFYKANGVQKEAYVHLTAQSKGTITEPTVDAVLKDLRRPHLTTLVINQDHPAAVRCVHFSFCNTLSHYSFLPSSFILFWTGTIKKVAVATFSGGLVPC